MSLTRLRPHRWPVLLAAGLAAGCSVVPPREVPRYAPAYPRVETTPAPVTGAIFRGEDGSRYGGGLFEDHKARRVGDVLTIVLQENTNASKSASTATSKSDDITLGAPGVFGRTLNDLEAGVSAERDFEGNADVSQSNSLSGNLSVTVVEALANGNLVVRGEKWLTLNQGEEYVQITGIVRPADIGANNSVASSQVADARITYSGRGVAADANTQGWLSRFFSSPLWPF